MSLSTTRFCFIAVKEVLMIKPTILNDSAPYNAIEFLLIQSVSIDNAYGSSQTSLKTPTIYYIYCEVTHTFHRKTRKVIAHEVIVGGACKREGNPRAVDESQPKRIFIQEEAAEETLVFDIKTPSTYLGGRRGRGWRSRC